MADISATTAPRQDGTATPRGAARDLTPDVSRGIALLGIAIVNATLLCPRPLDGPADRIATALMTLLLENRMWPMFAVLFGWGIAAISAHLASGGADLSTRSRVLIRRDLLLVALGTIQVVLAFWADILAVYGLTGIVVVVLMRRGSRRLGLMLGVVGLCLWCLGTFALTGGGDDASVPSSTDWAGGIVERLAVFGVWTVGNTVLLTHLAPMLVGVALFGAGVLHRPAEHRRLLHRLASVGSAVGVLGALPMALMVLLGASPAGAGWAAASALQAGTGIPGGIAAVCLVGLWSARRRAGTSLGGPAHALAAIGRRPLTSYLLHALLLSLAFSPWALGLRPGAIGVLAVGGAVGLVCALVAAGLEAAGLPGPADVGLRRLTYGRRPGPSLPRSPSSR